MLQSRLRMRLWDDTARLRQRLMTDRLPSTGEASRYPFRVADRYEARELLGRGGMASVYRAWDEASERAVALKVLTPGGDDKQAARNVELFEREFHTLVTLAHPRVVQAHDYGFEGASPYYSMELLDGGDLRELAPLPWQEICTIAYEICSALSLLHSRRLVHRDLTPRNIRRTQAGQAKVIDFGLLSPMGPTSLLAGTPPFVSPELLGTMSLDGRSDLFSLGAALYFALTKRMPYSARTFDQLQDAWRSSPARPSTLVPGVPRALDDLLLGMLRIDVGSRPKSAAEVMERLVPLLPEPPGDELRAARAYLFAPKLVGRGDVIVQFRKQMMRAMRGRGGGFAVIGEEGSGRSRMLDAFVLEAKLVGATAVRAGAADATRPFGVAASLAQQLHGAAPAAAFAAAAAHPAIAALFYPDAGNAAPIAAGARARLSDVAGLDLERAELQSALRTWLLEFASRRPLAIAVDDFERIDEPSAALIASLTWEAPSRRLVYAGSLQPGDPESPDSALGILRKHASEITLAPLTDAEVTALLASLFGDVPNLEGVAARIAGPSGGRPRECISFAQHLVDEGAITYAGGSWTLPTDIPEGLLPASLEDAFARRITLLGPLSRHLAAMLAENLVDRISRAEWLRIGLAPSALLDTAIDELQAARLVSGDPSGYALSGGGVARILTRSLTVAEKLEIHQELSTLHESSGGHLLLMVHHGLGGHHPEAALDRLLAEATTSESRTVLSISAALALGTNRTVRALELALTWAERLGRGRRDLQAFWVMLAGAIAQGADPAPFYRVKATWLSQLKHDSGFDDWLALDPSLDPAARAMMAVGAASQRYSATPEEERVLSPLEAIQQLVSYVVFSIAISARVLDLELQASLPELLVPFAPLNPMVAAMLTNARGTSLFGEGKRERAHDAAREVLDQLEQVGGAELRYVDKVRAAVTCTLATIDTSLGIHSVWISRFEKDQDPNQRVSAWALKRIAALHQGDWEMAEAHRRRGELLSLETSASSMFSILGEQLDVHAMARDLTGLMQVRAGIRAMADRCPGWRSQMHVADAHYHRLRGDFSAALAAVELAVSEGERGTVRSPSVIAGRTLAVELLAELGRADEAFRLGKEELARCEALGMRYFARNLSRAVAAAEAKLGQTAPALERVQAVITEQVALGVTGLALGRSYELGARIALEARYTEAFRTFAALAREQYHPGESSVLGALYERLMDDGRQAGVIDATPDACSDTKLSDAELGSVQNLTLLMTGCATARERAERALGLLCDGDPPTRGHLFLFTDDGLALVASNTPCESVTEIIGFARSCVERESEASSMATEAMLSVALGTVSAEWHDAQGRRYEPVLLAATVGGTFCIGGVALLESGAGVPLRNASLLADSLAQILITAGDTRTVAAA